jgi:hypothetical protein
MLDLIDQTFPMIWANIIIVVNQLQQDEKSKKRREKNGRSDPELLKMI